MNKYAEVPDEVVYAVTSRFLTAGAATGAATGATTSSDAAKHKKLRAQQIADAVSREYGFALTREMIYPLLAEARRRGYLALVPPMHIGLAQRIITSYGIDPEPRNGAQPVQVVNVHGRNSMHDVAVQAARVATNLIIQFGHRKRSEAASRSLPAAQIEPVRIGLASGWSTRLVSTYLARFLCQEREVPALVIHALSSGFSVDDPATSSVGFFNLFQELPDVRFVGLFSPPYVPAAQYDTIIAEEPGLSKAFSYKEDIDIVISALAARSDDHGELRKYIREVSGLESGLATDIDACTADTPSAARPRAGTGATGAAASSRTSTATEFFRVLIEQGWVGDVQYRPYSNHAPITSEVPLRAVTIYELADLVRMAANPHKAVLLVAGPCGICGTPRHQAVMPLLAKRELRVWSHIVMDTETARNCLDPSAAIGVA